LSELQSHDKYGHVDTKTKVINMINLGKISTQDSDKKKGNNNSLYKDKISGTSCSNREDESPGRLSQGCGLYCLHDE
jgi:hypothetical protein